MLIQVQRQHLPSNEWRFRTYVAGIYNQLPRLKVKREKPLPLLVVFINEREVLQLGDPIADATITLKGRLSGRLHKTLKYPNFTKSVLYEARFITPNYARAFDGEVAELLRLFDTTSCLPKNKSVMRFTPDQMPPEGSFAYKLLMFLMMSYENPDLRAQSAADFLAEYDIQVLEHEIAKANTKAKRAEEAQKRERATCLAAEAEKERERAEKDRERANRLVAEADKERECATHLAAEAEKENMLRSSDLGFYKLGLPIESIAQTLGVCIEQVEAILARE